SASTISASSLGLSSESRIGVDAACSCASQRSVQNALNPMTMRMTNGFILVFIFVFTRLFCRHGIRGVRSGLDLYLDAADEGVGGIGDDTIGRRDTASDFDRLAEIPADLDLSQFHYTV